jgi:hypothetical protein
MENKNVMPEMTVMQPTVKNVSNEVAPENVASEGLSSKIEYTPVTESSYDGIKGSFLLDDELAHFVPTKEIIIPDVNLDNREDGK